MAAVARHFRPEFLNRIDEIVLFRGLDRAQLRQITELLLEQTHQRLRSMGVTLSVDERAVDWLANRGHRPESGARPLRRTIGRELDKRLSRMLLAGDIHSGRRVTVSVIDDRLNFAVRDQPDAS
jgi:ATP-dependent Clp protease ATP-binding subunit ClpC